MQGLPSNLDINSIPDIQCNKCSNVYWETLVTLKNVPAASSPTGQDALVPIPAFRCTNCGMITNEYYKKP